MSAKNVNNYSNYNWKTFRYIFGQLHKQKYKASKKQVLRLQLNEKSHELILKTKADLKGGDDDI